MNLWLAQAACDQLHLLNLQLYIDENMAKAYLVSLYIEAKISSCVFPFLFLPVYSFLLPPPL